MPEHQDEERTKKQKWELPKAEAIHTRQAFNNAEEMHQQQLLVKAQEINEQQEVQQHKQQLNTLDEDQTQQIYNISPQNKLEKEKQQTMRVQAEVLKKSQLKKACIPQTVQKQFSHDCLNVGFDVQLKQTLEQNKLMRVVFNHFCKENNLMSIKTSLFQDKQKKWQEMSLNKWMVFCKQFRIDSKLCKIKNKVLSSRVAQCELPLQTSQVRQMHRMKQVKEIQNILVAIFKHSSKNTSKLTFQSFVIAISNIFYHFKYLYPQDEKGIRQFLAEVLYCSDEKTCYKQLSHLKFTSTTPQIEYNKLPFHQGQLRTKAKAVLAKTKQNYESRANTLSSKENKLTQSRKSTKFNLNPVLIQAKRSLNQMNSYSKRCHNYQLSLSKLNTKPNQPIRTQHQTSLINFFQTTKDAILDSYFMLQSGKKMSEIRF